MNIAKRAIRRFSFWLLAVTDAWEPVEPGLMAGLEDELARYPGEWVAIAATHDRIVAHGATPAEVIAAADALGEKGTILHRVSEPGAVYVLTGQAS